LINNLESKEPSKDERFQILALEKSMQIATASILYEEYLKTESENIEKQLESF